MGSFQAADMADQIQQGRLDLETAIRWHLQSNHYPPVHESFVPVALQAICAVNREEFEHRIELPNGLTNTAAEIINGLHLHEFCEEGGEPDDTI
jgi:hypothetical protein